MATRGKVGPCLTAKGAFGGVSKFGSDGSYFFAFETVINSMTRPHTAGRNHTANRGVVITTVSPMVKDGRPLMPSM